MTNQHLAQINAARLRARIDNPPSAECVDAPGAVNAIGDECRGLAGPTEDFSIGHRCPPPDTEHGP